VRCFEYSPEHLFAADPSEKIICPLHGTVALDAGPVEDRVLHIHCRMPVAAPVEVEPEAPRLSA